MLSKAPRPVFEESRKVNTVAVVRLMVHSINWCFSPQFHFFPNGMTIFKMYRADKVLTRCRENRIYKTFWLMLYQLNGISFRSGGTLYISREGKKDRHRHYYGTEDTSLKMKEVEKGRSSVQKSKLPLYISIAIIGALIIAYFFIPSVEAFLNKAWAVLTSDNEERIKSWVNGFGWFGPTVLILAMVVQMFLLIIPTLLLMVVSILAYGPVWGSAIIFVSVFAASSVGYFMGSYFNDVIVTRIIGKKMEEKVKGFLDDYGFWAVIVTRLNPFLSNDAISFVGGLLRMGYWKFMGATIVGIAPLTLFIAVMGKSTDSLKMGLLWGSLGSLLIFGIYVWWDKHRKRSSK